MLVFLSYQTDNRHIAAEVSAFFKGVEFDTFMAHEHIEVSHQWQEAIMDALDAADIFVAILTENYLASPYCIQESGIAVYLEDEMTIMPLAVDGTLPPGFMRHIQGRPFHLGQDNDAVLFGGVAKYDVRYAVDLLVNRLGLARSWREAEKWFDIFWPYRENATPNQKLDVLIAAAGNDQFANSIACRVRLIDLYDRHGHRLERGQQNYLENALMGA